MSTNPNGANQYQLDPRQNLCWKYYIDPTSETFGNGLQSALKAGYDEEYSKQITVANWFVEKLRRLNMLNKAENVLDKTLTYEPIDDNGKVDTSLLRVQADVAKHITKTLGKDLGYSERTELTGKDGEKLEISVVKYEDNDTTPIQSQDISVGVSESTTEI